MPRIPPPVWAQIGRLVATRRMTRRSYLRARYRVRVLTMKGRLRLADEQDLIDAWCSDVLAMLALLPDAAGDEAERVAQ